MREIFQELDKVSNYIFQEEYYVSPILFLQVSRKGHVRLFLFHLFIVIFGYFPSISFVFLLNDRSVKSFVQLKKNYRFFQKHFWKNRSLDRSCRVQWYFYLPFHPHFCTFILIHWTALELSSLFSYSICQLVIFN